MPVLALDIGTSRIGVARVDALGSSAVPLPCVSRAKGDADAIAAIVALVAELAIETIVYGLPLALDGREGLAVKRTRALSDKLREALPALRFVEIDERLSTLGAERLLRDAGHRGRAQRERIDSAAAALLLEVYLGQRANTER